MPKFNYFRFVFYAMGGVVGGIVGFYDVSMGRSLCYYASDRGKCYVSYNMTRFILETTIAAVLGFLISIFVTKVVVFLKQKKTRTRTAEDVDA